MDVFVGSRSLLSVRAPGGLSTIVSASKGACMFGCVWMCLLL